MIPTRDPLAPERRLTSRERRHLRREQQNLASDRQDEWSLGAPDATAGTGRPGTSAVVVANLTRDLAAVEGELREARR